MKKRITWTTFIVFCVFIISMSANLIAGAYWQCGSNCEDTCSPRCEGHSCSTVDECCGYCENGEGQIICLCCRACGKLKV